MNYTHLTLEERYQIYVLLREGFSKRHIASFHCCAVGILQNIFFMVDVWI
ncbi:helix-turn-helix domain-containing protein [Acinetobacter marinus]